MLSVSGYRGVVVKEYDTENRKRTAEELENYLVVRPDNLAVNTMWLNYCGLGVSQHEGLISPAYRVYRLDSRIVLPAFMHHLFRSQPYVEEYTRLAYGIRPNSLQVNVADFGDLPVPLIPLQRQRGIATFLDRTNVAIDALIAKKDRLVELLQEKRRALITQAVTKGLVPAVSRKDSGNQWLGNIPTHWSINKAVRLCKQISKGTTPAFMFKDPAPGCVPFLLVQNLTFTGGVVEDDLVFISEETHRRELSRSKVFPGDVLINIVGPPLGKVGVVGSTYKEWNVNQAIAFFRAERINPRFLAYWLQTHFASSWFWQRVKKTSGQANLTLELCRDLPVCVPPPSEQFEICAYLDETLGVDAGVIARVERQRSLLGEYRQALITAAVTGKLDLSKEDA
jgi:type I restriction enzyme S subunit